MQTHYFLFFDKIEVRQRLILAFLESGLSQSSLARIIDMTQPQVSYIVKSKSFPRESTLQKMAKGLRVSYRWVLFGQGKMKFYFNDYPNDEFHIDFPNKLTYLLWSNGYDQISFAEKINYSQALIEYYIKAQRRPSGSFLEKLTVHFNITEEWLLKEDYTLNRGDFQ